MGAEGGQDRSKAPEKEEAHRQGRKLADLSESAPPTAIVQGASFSLTAPFAHPASARHGGEGRSEAVEEEDADSEGSKPAVSSSESTPPTTIAQGASSSVATTSAHPPSVSRGGEDRSEAAEEEAGLQGSKPAGLSEAASSATIVQDALATPSHPAASQGGDDRAATAENEEVGRRESKPRWADLTESLPSTPNLLAQPPMEGVEAPESLPPTPSMQGASSSADGIRLPESAMLTAQPPKQEIVQRKKADPKRPESAQAPAAPRSLPSAGSRLHEEGKCKPCIFVRRREGCAAGAACNFCHFDHPIDPNVVRPSKTKRLVEKKLRRQNLEALFASGSSSGSAGASTSGPGGSTSGPRRPC